MKFVRNNCYCRAMIEGEVLIATHAVTAAAIALLPTAGSSAGSAQRVAGSRWGGGQLASNAASRRLAGRLCAVSRGRDGGLAGLSNCR